jgi:hypothetical protein
MAWCLVQHRDNFTFTFGAVIGQVTSFIFQGFRALYDTGRDVSQFFKKSKSWKLKHGEKALS